MAHQRACIRITSLLFAGALLITPLAARADIFHLSNGGRIVGTELAVPAGSRAPDELTIRLREGGQLRIARRLVERHERTDAALIEYLRLARELPPTVEAHWTMAEWCRTHDLAKQRTTHLERILELDPDHVPARRGLGYYHFRGEWVTYEQVQQRAGYVRYNGRWRTRQEIDLIVERKAARAAQIEWRDRLARWRTQLLEGKPREAQQAQEKLLNIEDPHAIDPLTALICSEPLRPCKLLFIRALRRIPHPRAVHQLTYLSLVDGDEGVYEICMREVVARRQPETLKTYLQALKNNNNLVVNRAARAIQQLEERDAIGPLIEALFTSHAVATPQPRTPTGLPAGESTFTFATDDTGKTTPMSQRRLPPVVNVQVANHDVLSALVSLSGGLSFGFDQEAWQRWHASKRQQVQTVATIREDAQ
jgi:hypothetical protein